MTLFVTILVFSYLPIALLFHLDILLARYVYHSVLPIAIHLLWSMFPPFLVLGVESGNSYVHAKQIRGPMIKASPK